MILLKSRWWPLLVGGSVLVAAVGLFWWLQQKNVDSFDSDIDALKKQINNLQTTVAQREQLNQQIGSLKQQINGLPDKVASKQLNSQVEELKKQIDTLPDPITSKEQITLEKDRLVLEKDRVNAQNAIYGTLIQAVGGVFFFVTAYFTYRNVRAIEANVKAAEEKQVTERFSKAIEQLGNDNIHVRLGGIYALERIANDSDKDYWQVIEVLTTYIQEKSPYPPIIKNEGVVIYKPNGKPVEEQKKDIPPIPTDIQAVLTVLARRRYAFGEGEKHPLDLNRTNLQRANLWGANLWGANLIKANLQGAFLNAVNLQGAFLGGANLEGAELNFANLEGGHLIDLNLQEADLRGADLRGADLRGARLQRATLNFANLQGARLWEANLQETSLKKAILKDVFDLDSVVGLTREQISQINQERSNIDEAMLPDYLRTPESSQTQPPDPQQT